MNCNICKNVSQNGTYKDGTFICTTCSPERKDVKNATLSERTSLQNVFCM